MHVSECKKAVLHTQNDNKKFTSANVEFNLRTYYLGYINTDCSRYRAMIFM
jgi:hypothetical protein